MGGEGSSAVYTYIAGSTIYIYTSHTVGVDPAH